MAHLVGQNENGTATMAARTGVPVWHGLAQWFGADEEVLPSEINRQIGGDFQIYKGSFVATAFNEATQETITVPSVNGDSILIRGEMSSDKRNVAWDKVSKDYVVIQPQQAAESLDRLSKQVKLDTAGVVKNGEVQFFSFKGDSFDVLLPTGYKDEMILFLNFINRLNKGGFKGYLSPTQPVCWNTVQMVEKNYVLDFTVGHRGDVPGKMEITTEMLSRLASQSNAVKTAMQNLADMRITDDQANEIFESAAPFPVYPKMLKLRDNDPSVAFSEFPTETLKKAQEIYDGQYDRACNFVRYMNSEYLAGEVNPGVMGTAYGALAAVTHTAQWVAVGERTVNKERMSESAFLGDRALMPVRAYNKIASMMK